MQLRHAFLLVLALVTAVAVGALWWVRRTPVRPTDPPLQSDPRSTFVDYGATDVDDRKPVPVSLIFGKCFLCPPTVSPYLISEDALQPRAALAPPDEGLAMLATQDGDAILLRGRSRVKGWLDGARRILVLEAGEIVLDVGDREWEVRSKHGAVRARNFECGFRAADDATTLAVSRGPVFVPSGVSSDTLPVAEGEVVHLKGGPVGGSMNDEPETVMAWAREAREARNLLKQTTVAAKPSARYHLRGRNATGDVVARTGDRQIARWSALPPLWSVTFDAPPDARELTVDGRFDAGELFEVGGD